MSTKPLEARSRQELLNELARREKEVERLTAENTRLSAENTHLWGQLEAATASPSPMERYVWEKLEPVLQRLAAAPQPTITIQPVGGGQAPTSLLARIGQRPPAAAPAAARAVLPSTDRASLLDRVGDAMAPTPNPVPLHDRVDCYEYDSRWRGRSWTIIKDVKVKHATTKALLCYMGGEPGVDADEVWWPLGMVHEDCQLKKTGDTGELIVATEVAEGKGVLLQDFSPPDPDPFNGQFDCYGEDDIPF